MRLTIFKNWLDQQYAHPVEELGPIVEAAAATGSRYASRLSAASLPGWATPAAV